MPKKNPLPGSDRRLRIERLRQRIAAFELVCSGNLMRRTKVCGKPNCCCASDERQRHGPYWEWTRRQQGKLVHSVISPQQAAALAAAIRNGRQIQRLIALWERESVRIIEANADATLERGAR